MRDFIAAALIGGILFCGAAPIAAGYWINRRRQIEIDAQRKRALAREESGFFDTPYSLPKQDTELQVGEPTAPLVMVSTDTGEIVRLGDDGVPLSEADLSARTPSTTYTVDTERLAEILQMEQTGEYALNPATWAEIGAAEAFMRDPLGSAVLPPLPLTEEAGNPALAEAFWKLINDGGLSTDWEDADSEFHFWDRESALAAA